ncbi:Hypothetical predicted protein [Mytilus galloprovincialis]|uniref:G-protein coupled receptors family 1 profile domain-containing protein n=1 Tax=Mytilus galloprovincialis TaxID=29158 RepID=A0A8B6EXY6_MYTGA|nr:Hypothetical predicted protein [Mytilus galloprovincialis]
MLVLILVCVLKTGMVQPQGTDLLSETTNLSPPNQNNHSRINGLTSIKAVDKIHSESTTKLSPSTDTHSLSSTIIVNLTSEDVAISLIANDSNNGLIEKNGNRKKGNDMNGVIDYVKFVQNVYVLPPLCMAGIAGNTVVGTVLFKQRSLNSSFIYMFAMVVADILSLISDLFISAGTIIEQYTTSERLRKHSIEMSHWSGALVSFTFRCTAINIVCILSIERFIAISYPFHLKSALTVRFPLTFVFLAFLVGIFANIAKPINIKFMDIQKGNTSVYGAVRTDFYVANKKIMNTVVFSQRLFTGPVQIIMFCVMNALIIRGMLRNRKNMGAIKAVNSTMISDRKHLQVKLCKLFLVLCAWNILAFLPNSILLIIARFFPKLGLSNLRSYTAWLIGDSGDILRVINSASDFIVIILMSSNIRKSFYRIFKCKTK